MDEELKKRIADYFTAAELVDLLEVDTSLLVDYIEELLEENIEEIEEFMTYGR